jgi:hypothetical protein
VDSECRITYFFVCVQMDANGDEHVWKMICHQVGCKKSIWAGHNCVGRCPTDASASRCDAVSVRAWMHPTGLWMHNVWLRCTCRSGAGSASLCTAATAVHCVPRTHRAAHYEHDGVRTGIWWHRIQAPRDSTSTPLCGSLCGLPHCTACAAARSEVTKATAPPQHTCLFRTYPTVPSREHRDRAGAAQQQATAVAHTHTHTHTHTALQLLHSAHAARHSRIRNMASYLPILWCFKASRDCTSHGDAPQTRDRQQIQKRHTQPANPYDCTRAQDTRTHGRSVHDTARRNSTARAANDTRQRRGTHRRKHARSSCSPAASI